GRRKTGGPTTTSKTSSKRRNGRTATVHEPRQMTSPHERKSADIPEGAGTKESVLVRAECCQVLRSQKLELIEQLGRFGGPWLRRIQCALDGAPAFEDLCQGRFSSRFTDRPEGSGRGEFGCARPFLLAFAE